MVDFKFLNLGRSVINSLSKKAKPTSKTSKTSLIERATGVNKPITSQESFNRVVKTPSSTVQQTIRKAAPAAVLGTFEAASGRPIAAGLERAGLPISTVVDTGVAEFVKPGSTTGKRSNLLRLASMLPKARAGLATVEAFKAGTKEITSRVDPKFGLPNRVGKFQVSQTQTPIKDFVEGFKKELPAAFQLQESPTIASPTVEMLSSFVNPPVVAPAKALGKGAKILVDARKGQKFVPGFTQLPFGKEPDDLLSRATKLFGEKRTVDLVPPGRGGQPMQRVGREGIEVPATPINDFQPVKEFMPIKSESQNSTSNSIFVRDKQTGDLVKIDFIKNKKTNQQTVERIVIKEDGTEIFSEAAPLSNLKEKYNSQDPEEIAKRFSLMKTEVDDVSELVATPPKNPLIEEAKKYKTADEFVKGQGVPVYTGRKKQYTDFAKTKADTLFFSGRKDVAEYYGGTPDKVTEGVVDSRDFLDLSTQKQKAKFVQDNFADKDILSLFPTFEAPARYSQKAKEEYIQKFIDKWKKDLQDESFSQGDKQKLLLNIAKEKNYPGIILKDATMEEKGIGSDLSYVVFDKSKVKTKSELKQIWEEANQPKQITQPTPKTKSMGTVGGEKNVAFLKGGDEAVTSQQRLENYQNRLASGDLDTLDFIKEVSKTAKDKTRGTISYKQAVEDLLPGVKMTEESLGNYQAGKALNKEQTIAATALIKNQIKKIKQLEESYKAGSWADKAKLAAERELLISMYSSARGARAEAGRALQVYRELQKQITTPEKNLKSIMDYLESQNRNIDEFTEELGKIDLEDDIAIAKFLDKASNPSWKDKLMEIRINGLLSNIKTILKNVTSTAFNLGIQTPQKVIRAAVDTPFAMMTGKRERFFGEALQDIAGKKAGVQKVAKGISKTTKEVTGKIKKAYDDAEINFVGKINAAARTGLKEISDQLKRLDLQRIQGELPSYRPGAIKTPVVGELIRLPGQALALSDDFLKSIAFGGELYSEAFRKAAKTGKSKEEILKLFDDYITNTPDDLLLAADKQAEKLLFRADLEGFAKGLQKLRQESLVAQLLVPFLKTPANVIKEGIKYTPLGLIDTVSNLKKGAGRVQFVDDVSQLAFGSLVGATLWTKVLEGEITGSGKSYDEKTLKTKRAKGWQPYSIKIGNTYYSYKPTEPMYLLISGMADFAEALANKDIPQWEDKLGQFALGMGYNILDQSYLTGIKQILDAIDDPKRYGETFVESLATSFVPFSSALRQLTRQKGDILRDPDGIYQALESLVPGLNDNVPAMRDVWGRPIKVQSGALNIFQPSTSKELTLEDELLRLDVPVGDLNREVFGVKLNNENYSEYKKYRQLLREQLVNVANSPQYAALKDADKTKAIENYISEFDKALKNEIGAAQLVKELELDIDPQLIPVVWDALEEKNEFKKLSTETQKKLLEEWATSLISSQSQ